MISSYLRTYRILYITLLYTILREPVTRDLYIILIL